jgi:rhamnose utilization protein RhaD (predicted bifunctional aldolase and dehydrogenase)/NAD(P)-dependent dehydrogenase (short-subunit alcohol dehydrogenase family)
MRNGWSEEDAARFVEKYSSICARETAATGSSATAASCGSATAASGGSAAAAAGGADPAANSRILLALRTYSSRLLGAEESLVLHGGGNTSVKAPRKNVFGLEVSAIFVKASGFDMSDILPEGHTGLDLEYLKQLRRLAELSDQAMINEFRTHMFDYKSKTPSLETLMHAFIDRRFIDHTHPDAILALTNLDDAKKILHEALSTDIIILEYIKPGFRLAFEAAAAYDARPGARAMILMHHGLVTWGDTARASYEQTIEAVNAAEAYIANKTRPPLNAAKLTSPETLSPKTLSPEALTPEALTPEMLSSKTLPPEYAPELATESVTELIPESVTELIPELAHELTRELAPGSALETAWKRYESIAPLLRGILSPPSGDPDRPHRNVILRPVISSGILDFLKNPRGRALSLTPPLTTDFLIRTKALPVWLDCPDFSNPDVFKERMDAAVSAYSAQYNAYYERHAPRLTERIERFDSLPRVVLIPGLGAVCAGYDAEAAKIAADITDHTLRVKASIGAMGQYAGLDESHLFDMEYRSYQHAKLSNLNGPDGSDGVDTDDGSNLRGRVAVVTGSAGAIGTGICRRLLQAGCHVALTDLPGEPLEKLLSDLKPRFGLNVTAVPMDVTDPESVTAGFAQVVRQWGGVDILVANAGVALVMSLMDMRLEDFRRLERVNVEGTLTALSEAGRLFARQETGGDIVLVSSKNVFAPGAQFGAYSATKAAAHQLARIASLEFAPMDVRVNMVSPDAVFSEGGTKSGLWKEIGPGRMKARGLDENGLEDYYRSRNLLKARITAGHVANAVLYFVTRRTPTTGATLPVDGGLPDASPR